MIENKIMIPEEKIEFKEMIDLIIKLRGIIITVKSKIHKNIKIQNKKSIVGISKQEDKSQTEMNNYILYLTYTM